VNVVANKLYAACARALALTTSTSTNLLTLFAPTSMANMLMADSLAVDATSSIALVLCAVGWADVLWTDIRGRLIWPSLAARTRHHWCVLVYGGLAAVFAIRLFTWADPSRSTNIILAIYYLLAALCIGTLAVAIALEQRNDAP
jgi:hypothetical protein